MKQQIAPRYILPPHILSSIAQHGNEEQRQRALHTMGHDNTLRSVRMTHNLLAPQRMKGRADFYSDKALERGICNNSGMTDRMGDCVRSEGSHPIDDIAANEAYDALGWAHAFYMQAYGRNSIDDEGMKLEACVHYGMQYDNAFWNGERMVIGDGDNDLFNRFTVSIDIIGHELTHGITQDEAQLVYMGQAGALNESLSDIFGCLIKQYANCQTTDQADWLIGQGIFTDNVHGEALRSLKNPGQAYDDPILGRDPQPAHMHQYVHTGEDNGGIHINSGIPNHAFYHVATRIGGHAWERAGRIWYETLRDPRLRATCNFRSFARLTLASADRLFGHGSREWNAVHDAWQEVGVSVPQTVSNEPLYAYEGAAAD